MIRKRESEDSDADTTYLGQWERSLKNINLQPCHSLKQRQLNLLAAGVKRAVEDIDNQEERAQKRVLEETRQRWISLGMMREEDAPLLQSVSGPYHPNIESSREEYFAKKKEEEEWMLEKKAREYYNNDWITDEDTKRTLLHMMEVTAEALKLKFQKEEVPGLAKLVLLQRRKKAVEMQWVSPTQAERITSSWCPLPYPREIEDDDDDDDDDDDEPLFITPSAAPRAHSLSSAPKRSYQKRRSQPPTSTPMPKRGRITHFFSLSQQ